MNRIQLPRFALLLTMVLGTPCASPLFAQSAQAVPASPFAPYLVEWVYRAKWGAKEEFLDLFKKYQVPILDREKELGYILAYAIYTPMLHTSEDNRWDYRVVITYKDQAASTHSSDVEKQVFPDREKFRREERRRWELTLVHWDLPIRAVDPHGTD